MRPLPSSIQASAKSDFSKCLPGPTTDSNNRLLGNLVSSFMGFTQVDTKMHHRFQPCLHNLNIDYTRLSKGSNVCQGVALVDGPGMAFGKILFVNVHKSQCPQTAQAVQCVVRQAD